MISKLELVNKVDVTCKETIVDMSCNVSHLFDVTFSNRVRSEILSVISQSRCDFLTRGGIMDNVG